MGGEKTIIFTDSHGRCFDQRGCKCRYVLEIAGENLTSKLRNVVLLHWDLRGFSQVLRHLLIALIRQVLLNNSQSFFVFVWAEAH